MCARSNSVQQFAKLSSQLWRNEKTRTFAVEHPEAFAVWTFAISYAVNQRSDGLLSGFDLRVILGASPEQLDQLVEANLFERLEDGCYLIHDFTETQGRSLKDVEHDRRQRARKAAAVRWGGKEAATEPEAQTAPTLFDSMPEPTPDTAPSPETDPIEAVIDAYPSHRGNPERNREAVERLIRDEHVNPDDLLQSVKTYRHSSPSAQYVPSLANWISRRQWRDHMPARAKPGIPGGVWLDRNLYGKLPPDADLHQALTRIHQLVNGGVSPETAAEQIIKEHAARLNE